MRGGRQPGAVSSYQPDAPSEGLHPGPSLGASGWYGTSAIQPLRRLIGVESTPCRRLAAGPIRHGPAAPDQVPAGDLGHRLGADAIEVGEQPADGSRCIATAWRSGVAGQRPDGGAPRERARRRASARHCTRTLRRLPGPTLRRPGIDPGQCLCWARRAVRERMASPRSACAGVGRTGPRHRVYHWRRADEWEPRRADAEMKADPEAIRRRQEGRGPRDRGPPHDASREGSKSGRSQWGI